MKKSWTFCTRLMTASARSSSRPARKVVAIAGEPVGLDAFGRLVGGLAPALVISLMTARAIAGPEGAQVAAGNVTVQKQGDKTVIHASNNSIINFKSFDIAKHETVQFVQPDALARVLNRINSASPTQIDGKLLANGRVFIVNPAGVIFGQGAVVNAAGIYAAAGHITDADFVKGIYKFTDVKGSVLNKGMIEAKDVALIGKSVANTGTIIADKGAVIMASGDSVMVGEVGGRVYVKVEQQVAGPAGASGSSASTPANSSWAVGDMYSLAIRNTGTIKAKTVHVEAKTGVVNVGGSIDASTASAGEHGGSVKVLGQYVGVSGSIDASGPAGGGEVLVGGNYQGHGAEANAIRTAVSPDATVRADATSAGDGGRVIIWSNDQTNYAGHISARGAGESGHGGFAEVSGKENLRFAGTADLSGQAGNGSLLLDPAVITIQGGSGDGDVDGTATFFGDPSGTEGSIAFADVGPTTVFESEIEGLVGAAAANIVLQATDSINATGAFTAGLALGATNFTLQTSNATTAGTIDLSGVSISSTSGNITILGATSGVEASTITLGQITTGAGGISVSNGKGDVTVGGALATTGGGVGLTTLDGALNINATVTVTGAADILLNSTGGSTTVAAGLTSTAGAITFGNTGTGSALISANVAGNTGVTLTNAASLSGTVSISSDTSVVSVQSSLATGSGDVTLRGDQVDLTGGAGSVTGTGTLTLRPTSDGTAISIGDAAAGGFDLDSTDVAALGSTFSLITIGSSSGNSLATIGSAAFDSPVTIQEGALSGQIALTPTAVLTTSNDALTLTAGTGDSGSFTKPDAATIDAGSGDIRITADAIDLGAGAATIATTGTIFVRPATSTRDIVIAGSGTASQTDLTEFELVDVLTGQSQLTIGLLGGQHAIELNAASFDTATTIRTPVGGAITVNGAVTAPSLTLTGAKTLATGASLAGTTGLLLDGGSTTVTGASVSLSGGTGTLTTGAVSVGTNQATLTGDEITIDGAITGSGASSIVLQPSAGSVSIDVGVDSGGSGTLDISDAEIANISGVFALTIGSSGGTHAIEVGDITFAVPTTIRATGGGGTITVNGAISAPGIRLAGVKTFNTGAAVTASGVGNTITLDLGAGTLAAALTLTGDEIDLGSSLGGAFALTLRPFTGGSSIGVGGGAGTLDLSDADIGNISGTSGITIGAIGGSSVITTDTVSFADPVLLGGSTVAVAGTLTGTGDATIILNGTGIALGGNLVTSGRAISLQGPVTLTTAAPTIDSTNSGGSVAGANVTFTDTVDAQAAGTQGLTVSAGTGGTIDLQDVVGTTSLAALSLDGGLLQFGAVTTSGPATFISRQAINSTGLLSIGGLATFQTRNTAGSNITVSNVANTFGSLNARTRSDDNAGGSVAGDIALTEAGNTDIELGEAGGSFAITSTGNVVFSGSVTAGTDVSSSGVAFTNNAGSFVQATDGGVTLTHTGAVTINDTIDATLNASTQNISITGSTVTANAAITADDDVSITGTSGLVTLAAPVASNSSLVSASGEGLTITSAGSVQSATTAALAGGTDDVNIGGPVTGGTGVTVSGAGFTNSAAVTATTGALTLTHTGQVDVNATLDAQAGAASVTGGDTTLTGSILASTTATVNAAGPLVISGDVSAPTSITLRSGTDGTGNLSFGAAGVDLSSASITLRAGDGVGGSATTATVDALTNAPAFHGAGGGATSPTTYVHRQDGSIIDAQIANAAQFQAATNVQGVNYTLQSDDGSVQLTDGTKVAGAILTISGSGPFVIASNIDFGNATVNIGAADVQASGVEVSVGTGTLTFTSTLSLNANGLTLTGDELNFTGGAGSVTGTGGLILQPSAGGLAIDVGTAADGAGLHISDADLAALGTNLNLVTVGRSGGTHAITIDSAVIRDPFVFRGSTATLVDNVAGSALNGTGRGSATFTTSTITLNDDVRTEGGPINFDGNVVLAPTTGNSITVLSTDNAATGADINFGGTTDSDGTPRDLTADAGIGTLTFFAQVGSSPLASITATAASINVPEVTTTGAQSFTGAVILGDNLTSTTAGGITVTGAATLDGDITIQTNGGSSADDISITGAIDGDGSSLTLNAGAAGGVSLGSAATDLSTFSATGASIATRSVTSSGSQTFTGPSTVTGSISTTSAGGVTFTGAAAVTGNVSTTAGSILFNNNASLGGNLTTTTSGAITGSGTTTLTGATQTFQTANGIITLGPVTGASNLTLNSGTAATTVGIVGATRLTSFSATGSTITTTGTVSTTGNQSYTGATTLGGNLSTTGGDTTVTGATTLAAPVTVGTSGGDIRLGSISGGTNPLTLTAGAGDIALSGDAGGLSSLTATGATIALRAVTTSGSQLYTGNASLGGALESDTAGTITVNGTSTLTAPISITTAGAASDDISLDAVVGGNNSLLLEAGSGDVELSANATDLSLFTVEASTISLAGVTSTGDQDYTGATTATGNLSTTTDGSISFTGDGTVAGNVSTTGGDIDFNNNASLAGNLTASGGNIDVTGTTTLTGASQNFTTSGGTVTLAAVNGPANLSISAPSAVVTVGTVGATPLQSFVASGATINMLSTATTTGGQTYDGNANFAGNLTTTGGAVSVTGDATVSPADLTVATSGGSVTFNGNLTGAGTSLVLNAGSGDVDVSGALHDLTDVGAAGLNSLTATGRDVTVGRVATNGSQTYTASRNLDLQGQLRALGASSLTLTGGTQVTINDNLRTGGAGSIAVNGPTLISGSSIGVLTGGGNISFANDINSQTDGIGALTANAGAGNVTFSGNIGTGAGGRLASVNASGANVGLMSVTTTQTQQYGGATFLDGDVQAGAAATFGGALTLLRDLQITATGVTFSQTVDSSAPGLDGLTVSAGAGNIAFQGAVGTTALQFLTATGQVTSGGIATTGDQVYTGSVNASGALQSTGGGITASGGAFTAAGDVTSAGALSINSAGSNVSLGGATSSASSTITGSSITLNALTTTAGDQTFTGNTTANGNLNSAGAISVTGGLAANGNVTAVGALNVAAGGENVSLTGATSASSITASGANVSVAGATSTSGGQSYTGETLIAGDLNATGGPILVTGTTTLAGPASLLLQAANQNITLGQIVGAGRGLTLNAGTGNVALQGAVTGLDSLAATGTSILVPAVTTVNDQTYTGSTTLGGNLTTTNAGDVTVTGPATLGGPVAVNTSGGAITLGGAVGGGNSLDLNAGAGVISMTGDATNLGSFNATGAGISTRSVTTAGPINFFGPAVVTGNLTSTTGGGVTMGSTATITGNVTTTAGSILLMGDAAVGGNLDATTTGDVVIAGNATLTGAAAQTFHSGQGFIILGNVDSADSTHRSLTLASGKAPNDDSVGARVQISGQIGSTNRLGTFQIGPADSTAPIPSIATAVIAPQFDAVDGGVVSSAVDFDNPQSFTINADNFVMNKGEKLTAFGNLTINADQVLLRDINTIGTLAVNSANIRLAGRARAVLVSGGGSIPSPDIGLDFVARNGVTFSSVAAIENLDGGTDVTFGGDVLTSVPQVTGGTSSFLKFENGITASAFQRAGGNTSLLLPLDLRADGRTTTNVATAIAGATPKEADIGPAQSIGISASLKDQLKEVGIYVKELTLDQQVDFLAGRAIYNDIPTDTIRPAGSDFQITPNRLAVDRVRDVITAHREIKSIAMRDAAPDAVWTDRAAEIVSEAFTACAKSLNKDVADVTGAELAAFVQSDPGQAQAKELLLAVKQFMEKINQLGLSPGEASVPNETVVGYLARDLTTAQVADAIAAIGTTQP